MRFLRYASSETYRQTNKQTKTYTLIAILRPPIPESRKIKYSKSQNVLYEKSIDVARPVRATSYSYGEWQNWRYQNSKTPEPIVTEFGTGDYVGTPHAKIQTDRPSGGAGPGKCVKYYSHVGFSFFIVFL